MKRSLFLDQDGLFADYDYAFAQISDIPLKGIDDAVMWSIIDKHPNFFAEIPPMPGAIEFFRQVRHLNPVILTACRAHDYAAIAHQKRYWARKYLCPEVIVIPVASGLLKHIHMNRPGDILVDDYGKNIIEWQKAGGVGIKHEGVDYEATLRMLKSTGIEGDSVTNHPDDIDYLAQEIRAVDGKHTLGAGALAERLMPAINARWARRALVEG